MPNPEAMLLERYARRGDAEAFSEIVRLYAGMVYGTCRRILGDPEQAADAAQETFFQLVKHADQVRESLISWLHRVATHKAVDRIRRESNRRHCEKEYCAGKLQRADQWQEVSPYVDEAIDELEESLRRILTCHFLQGQSMNRIAEAEQVSQATISRRVETALDQLRQSLERRGVVVAGAGLGTMLVSAFVEAAPAGVLEELGKMAMVGTTAAVSGSAAAGTVTAGASAAGTATGLGLASKLAVAVVVAALGTAGYIVYHNHPKAVYPSVANPLLSDSDIIPARSAKPAADTTNLSSASTLSQDEDFTSWIESTSMDSSDNPEIRGDSVVDLVSESPQEQGGMMVAGGSVGFGGMGFGGGLMGTVGVRFDTPNDTVTSFINLLETGQVDQLPECFVEGAPDAVQLQQILHDPQNPGEIEFNRCLKSLGSPVDVTRQVQGVNGLEVTWLCTVKEPFAMGDGSTSFMPGDRFELDATLVQIGSEWKMSGI